MNQNHHGITGHPPGRLIRRGALVLTACAGLALGAGAPALAASSGAAATGAQTSTGVAAPTARTVTLPTGDRVGVATVGGHAVYSAVGSRGSATAFSSFQDANGDHYVVPDEAEPFLGKQLDKSLFDVSALLRAGAAAQARIPVTLSYPAGTTPSAPPGVTLTSTGAGSPSGTTATSTTATGYLTAASGASFAAGLRAAIRADVTAGRHIGAGPLFGGLGSIGLAVPGAAPAAVQPRFPLHILQITATDITGAPADNALVFLANADAADRGSGIVPVNEGLGRIAVPAGNYSLDAQFSDFDASGDFVATRTVALDDFTVSDTAATSSVAVDERTATDPFSVTTPRPATTDALQIVWNRQATDGSTASLGLGVFGGAPYFSNSQPVPAVGTLHNVVQWGAAGPATGEQYRYDVAYGTDDIPANQAHVLRPRDIAAVHDVFYSDPAFPGGSSLLSGTFDGPGLAINEISGSAAYSGPLTDYLGDGDGGRWVQSIFTANGTQFQADVHAYEGGHDYQVEWAHGPLGPHVGRHTGQMILLPCMGCAAGGVLETLIDPAGDSEPDHVGFPLFGPQPSSHFTLYQNGTVVADEGDGFIGAEVTGVPAAPTTYRMVYDADSTGTGVSQSVITHTDITFRYVPNTDASDTLPASDVCDNGVMPQPCQVLPILNLNYHLFTDATNTSGSAVQAMRLDVGHLSYDGHGSHAPVTSATVSVSFDGGKTWKRAAVLGAFGSYVALWQNPASAAGTSPELRVTATDAAGGSITQTVASAYTIAASVH